MPGENGIYNSSKPPNVNYKTKKNVFSVSIERNLGIVKTEPAKTQILIKLPLKLNICDFI